ncbi:hypothetical protein EDD22DRAFT_844776 [Suillus occidentalis]|nr:hypothetical protein EDD22DRAFT_844776 [Suillus occidentalis]
MSASETANNALNATLADAQLLMRCCVKLAQGDPQALKLSNEITRCVAKDIKQYGADAMSFSPKLWSCTAVIRECSKAGTFETVLDWTTVSDQDQRIKTHPRFQKTVGYSLPNDDSPSKQLGPVVQEDDNITDQPGTTTVEVQLTLLTPLTLASVSPLPSSPPLPPHPAPKHNPFVPGHVKRKLANDATKSQEPTPKHKKQEASTQKDANTKGLDGTVVTPVEKCNKCKKLGMPYLILPNKKVSPPSTHTPLEQLQPPTAQTGEPKPTARDIFQGIQDLSRRFDLLATTLEQHLNASEEQHRAMSLTLDKLSMSLRNHSPGVSCRAVWAAGHLGLGG